MNQQRVLVVDDEIGMLRTVERILAGRYEVSTARSLGEAFERVGELAPDLAILDIRMPQKDGFEVMGELRRSYPDLDVIFMTGVLAELDTQHIRAIREKAFYFVQKPFDRLVLLTLVERCLELRRLGRENRRYVSRLETQLDEARKFQLGLLPPRSCSIEEVALEGRYVPCDELGGDFYDYVRSRDGRVAFVIADVSGHGVSAAMLTGIVKSAFHDASADDFEPLAVIRRISRGLRAFEDDRMLTAFCGLLDVGTGELEYVNAGHPPALLFDGAATFEQLRLTGPLVTPALPDDCWEKDRRTLASGARLLLYTDGVVEARNGKELFGEERLFALLDGSSPAELLDRVLDEVHGFSAGRPLDDDLTLLAVAR